MRKSVYIESSIIGYLTARLTRDLVNAARQLITQDWWETQKSSFNVCISAAIAQDFLLSGASAVPGLKMAMWFFGGITDLKIARPQKWNFLVI
jgi:hypothetical protein